ELRRLPLPSALELELSLLNIAGRFAVRSSATLEDLEGAAFAGAHDSYLNLLSADLPDRVRDCFVSLFSERAVRYRHRAGYAPGEARMAVVIQRMVDSVVAGVLFTVDPISGKLDHLLIDANFGLGESVVSGEDSVDHYKIDRHTGATVEKRIGTKSR